ncbi:ATP-dependent DNA helicase RecG [Glycomyces algeriensis]|uniref:Probable DNA 3'-5' helicase RecG n=1 Tax=Glycomyces algeriensis TaxID=256037 RepID=A0A9W6LJC0_9ACTN|nr:ATP-dependent DNA helicase RecG [Glycomyces algeriensis]MDA1366487.1 ATP-dependent DNA helicase RecG [Glycomyces algeriensis]MDR7352145.1 ATP-dependent DNA helicase RecG [Glycomyces algeriensis]GLI44879.1 ATP-dependent DNA helicase RecG [Glycomyces algeriensis]
MTIGLDTRLREVLGKKTVEALSEGLGLDTVGDLLGHYPFRYAQRGERTDLGALQIGEDVTVTAQVRAAVQKSFVPKGRGRGSRPGGKPRDLLEVIVADEAGRSLTLTFFNQAWRAKELVAGRWGLFAGKVAQFRGRLQLNSPQYQLLAEDAADPSSAIEEFAGTLIPVYPATAEIPTWNIAKAIHTVLDMVPTPPDPLPRSLREDLSLLGYGTALRQIHRPDSHEALGAAKKRLKWQEALVMQAVLVRRKAAAAGETATAYARGGALPEAFDARLPFTLTEGQRQVGEEIAAELAGDHPMHRLLQGDVGSGKTLVALRAMLQVVAHGGQAALLAPTEVLAAQHHRSIIEMLGDLARGGELGAPPEATRVALLTGSATAAQRRTVLDEVKTNTAGIVIGTHALLYDGVDFADLGFVVVDEQHRFGVEQRDALRAKADRPPHTLVMTATPIPRTVAMTVYGDLETSRLTELPAGRTPIATHVVPYTDQRWLARTWNRVREEVAAGRQAYVVCPRVGGDDAEDNGAGDKRPPLAVVDVIEQLRGGALSGLRLGLLHGRLDTDEKDRVMRAYAAGDLDVLVATTVIEVGVNVPNATAMVVLDAERFGISQLHQLRGRVGRGAHPGLCLLVSEAPEGSSSRERLDAVASTTDGFALAELDLEQRREGDVLGAAQSGVKSHVKLLSLLKDADIIEAARAEATALISADPELKGEPGLAELVDDLAADRGEFLEKG